MEQIQEIEKEEAIQARKELFEQRKQQKHKIAQLAGQVATVSMVRKKIMQELHVVVLNFACLCMQYDEWNAHDKQLVGYIKTKATPQIFYLPAEHNPHTEKLLAETTEMLEGV